MPRKFTFTTQVYDKKTDFPQTGDVDVIYIDASKNLAYRYDDSYYTISSAEVNIWGAMGSLSKGGGGGGGASWGSINGTLSNQTDLNTALSAKQNTLVSGTSIKTINSTSLLGSGDVAVQPTLTLTTTGTSGAATLVGATLNIPQYSGGGGGTHTPFKFKTTVLTTGATSAALVGSTLGNFTMGANNIHCYPYIPKYSFTANGLYLNVPVGVAGNLGRILIYQDNDGVPTTKLFESANLDLGTNGIKTAATTFSFVAGTVYWLAFHCNAVPSGSISGIPVASAINFAIQSTSPVTAFTRIVTFGTSSPSPLNPTSANNSVLPFIGITSA